jgi:hypothetical protein
VNWKWRVNNKLKDAFGEVNPYKKVVSINLNEHERCDEPLVDTFIHEQLHILFPALGEDEIETVTQAVIWFLSAEQLEEIEARYMAKLNEDARPVSK